MKRIIQLSAIGLLVAVIFAFNSNKKIDQFDSKYFDGNWTYRSLHNFPIDTPFCNLQFATAVMRFKKHSRDSIFGVLDMGKGFALNLEGN